MNLAYFVALVLATLATLSISLTTWRHRSALGGVSLLALITAVTLWTLFYALFWLEGDAARREIMLQVSSLGALAVPTIFLNFAFVYTRQVHWFRWNIGILLAIEPILSTILLVFYPLPGRLTVVWPLAAGMTGVWGRWFWIHLIYSYIVIAASLYLLLRPGRTSLRLQRGQDGAILIGALLPCMVGTLSLVGFQPFPGLDLTPFSFTASAVCLAVGLSRFHLLDLLPVARSHLVDSMTDSVIVLDSLNRVVDVNPAALKLLEVESRTVIGQPVERLLKDYPQVFDRFRDTLDTHEEVVVGSSSPVYLDLRITPIYDSRGGFSGRLISTRDITERRRAEQAEHQERLLAEALSDSAVALNKSHSFDEVLDKVFDNVGRVVPYSMAAFLLAGDDGHGHVVRQRGYDQVGLAERISSLDVLMNGLPNYKRMIETGQAIAVPDTQQCQEWVVVPGLECLRSYVGAPIRVRGIVVGFLDLVSLTPGFYREVDASHLLSFADQTAIALENARLLEEARRRAEEMHALFGIGLAVTSGLDMEHVLQTLLQKTREVLSVEVFYVAILDPETGIVQHPLAYDKGEFIQIPSRNVRETPGLSGYVINTRQTLYIPDMASPEGSASVQIFYTDGERPRSYVGVPLILGDRVVGVISMQSYRPNAYSRDQIRLLETIGTQAAVAIENSRLYHKAQQEINQREKAERRYRALFEQSHDAVFILDFKGRYREANQRAADLLGYSVEELLQLTALDITAQKKETIEILARLVLGEHIPLYEDVFFRKDGGSIQGEVSMELVRDEDGTPLHIQCVVRDISDRKLDEQALQSANQKLRRQLSKIKTLQEQLRDQAVRDSLTGLYNRRFLEETLIREFQRARREKGTICLIMVDIDGFKAFNDTYGHDGGDLLLRRWGEFVRSEIRSSDISFRYGGEEFLVVMPGASLEKGTERAEYLRTTFEGLDIRHMGVPLRATLSLGVAVFPRHGGCWEEVLHAADRALYAAKSAGKNCTRTAE
jgi:diguanylate cyclase (GGDEF)-like protein/PAS domain S-box-containing protein